MPLCYVVEDHNDTREGYAEYLRGSGFDVKTASSAAEFRQIVVEQVPGVVVMDLALPGTDGRELTRELKSDPRTKRVPVLVVSALVRPEDRESAEEAGADAFLSKPVDPQAIVAELHRLLARQYDPVP